MYVSGGISDAVDWWASGEVARGIRVGKRLRYRVSDLDAYLAQNVVEPKSAA